MTPPESANEPLAAVLSESRELGFLGPGPIGGQLEHARGFAEAVSGAPERFLDLGSGGGLPGLVLARAWPSARGTLLDSSVRRTEFLRRAVEALEVSDRISVVCARAESAARDPELRGQFEVVTARSFGPPAVTAECGVGFLAEGGVLVVSEPPADAAGRWPEDGLGRLGLERRRSPRREAAGFVVLRLKGAVDERWPRRVGIPRKRPLWR